MVCGKSTILRLSMAWTILVISPQLPGIDNARSLSLARARARARARALASDTRAVPIARLPPD